MKPFIGICRTASAEESGLRDQEECIRAYAKSKDYWLSRVHKIVEPASRDPARPLFWAIMEEAKESAHALGGIIFCSASRARSSADIGAADVIARERGLSLKSIEQFDTSVDAPSASSRGEHLHSLHLLVAKFQPGSLAERTRQRHEQRALAGLFVGRPPYGYETTRIDGRAVAVENRAEARVVKRLFRLVAEGSFDRFALRQALLSQRVTRNGTRTLLSSQQVRTILHNRAYIREVRYRGRWYPGKQTPMIERDMFDVVQEKLGEIGW